MKRTPKFHFRAIVRTVINNLYWLTEESIIEKKVSSKHPRLTIESKTLLRIPVEQRTPEQKEKLLKVMGSLQCFQRYPERVQEKLTESAMFAYFPPGRMLVREGHPSVAMYFIISGQANVSKMVFDPGYKKYKFIDVAVMNAGDVFGEINILHDEPWPTTVTTLSHIEILTVRKENFQSILEEFLGEQQRQITKCLSQFAYFKDWNHRTIVECCILARVVQYGNDVLILGENCGNSENSYFVLSGSCQIIYHLQVEHIRRKHHTELRIVEPNAITEEETYPASFTVQGLEVPKIKKIRNPYITGLIVNKLLEQMIYNLPFPETVARQDLVDEQASQTYIQSHFFSIGSLIPGACFGIGESLDRKFILSSSHPVTLLVIPRFFLRFNNAGNIWGRVREFFNHSYPSPQTIFAEFLMNRQWKRSREKYLETLISTDRPFTGLTSAEAPYYTRLTTDLENPIFRRTKKTIKQDKKI